MIHLTQNLLFRKGEQRACYLHPLNASQCIKILHNQNEGSPGDRETKKELAYYAYLKRRGISWQMLPFCYGQVDTNFGKGSVYDLVRDYDGNISLPFMEYLFQPEVARFHLPGLAQALVNLADYLQRERIVTKNLKQRNVVYQIRGKGLGRMYVVDDIGDTDFIPLSRFCGIWARKKIQRKWDRFEKHLLRSFTHIPLVEELLSLSHALGKDASGAQESCEQ